MPSVLEVWEVICHQGLMCMKLHANNGRCVGSYMPSGAEVWEVACHQGMRCGKLHAIRGWGVGSCMPSARAEVWEVACHQLGLRCGKLHAISGWGVGSCMPSVMITDKSKCLNISVMSKNVHEKKSSFNIFFTANKRSLVFYAEDTNGLEFSDEDKSRVV